MLMDKAISNSKKKKTKESVFEWNPKFVMRICIAIKPGTRQRDVPTASDMINWRVNHLSKWSSTENELSDLAHL
jgi:hypothetical protein